LLFFTKETSGPARRMESLVARIAARERGRLRLKIVDADRHPALVSKLAISDVPALVLLEGRRAVGRLEGRVTGAQIERMLARHLALHPPTRAG
jgi:thioredoxin-like negative regulator of GroEL